VNSENIQISDLIIFSRILEKSIKFNFTFFGTISKFKYLNSKHLLSHLPSLKKVALRRRCLENLDFGH